MAMMEQKYCWKWCVTHSIWPIWYDLNLTRGYHRFYYLGILAPFTVFDSFSHPFLLCQCLFTFCVVWCIINLRTVSQDQNATYWNKTRFSFYNFKEVQNNSYQTCDRFYNYKILHLLRCLSLFLISFYRVSICLRWENIEYSPLLDN